MGILWDLHSDNRLSFAKNIKLIKDDGTICTYQNIDIILKDTKSIIFTYTDIDGQHKVFYQGEYILTCD